MDNGITLCRRCHMKKHRKALPPPERISCACGCGVLIAPVDPYGRPRRYVNHHAPRGAPKSESAKLAMAEAKRGKSLTEEHKRKISDGGKGRIVSQETRLAISIAHRGKQLSADTRAKIGVANRGRKWTDEQKAKLALARKNSTKRMGRPPKPRL